MRHEIMLCAKANGQKVTGDLWFALAFRTEAELEAICQDLHIIVPAAPPSAYELVRDMGGGGL